MPLHSYADTLILKALRNDDEQALNHLFELYYNRLYRTGLKMGALNDQIEDCIQNVFIDLWRYRKTLGDIQSFEAYLISSLKHSWSKAHSKTTQVKTHIFESKNSNLSVESYEDILMQQQTSDARREKIRKTLDLLTNRQKEVIVMKYFDELSYDEMSQHTGLQKESLYKVLHEAIQRLKTLLTP